MNSQFKNSNLGFIIYAVLIGIIAAATFFMLWYMTVGYRVGTYGPDTRLGSVYIGGLRDDQIYDRVDEKVDMWYGDDTINFEIRYQDYSYELDRTFINFNLNMSTYTIEDGKTNKLVTSIQYTDQERIKSEILALPYMQNVGSNVDLQTMINDLLQDASLMKSYSSVNVEDYLIDNTIDEAVISSVTITLPQGVTSDDFTSVVNSVYEDGKILIPEKELFDLLPVFGPTMNDVELNILSNGMLELIHETNFLVNEVYYDSTIDFGRYTIDTFPLYGHNTKITEIVDQGFSFYNPNEYTYYFEIEVLNASSFKLNLIGLPFEYEIDVTIELEEINYITVEDTDVTLYRDGYNGVIVQVVRVITDVYNNEVDRDVIIFEYYPPVKEITSPQ